MATMFAIKELHESPTNPRKIRDAKADAELTESIRAHGIRTPLLLRARADGGHEVVCGSRRLRSARALKLEEVPGDLQELSDELALEVQCIENAQRQDVHPLDQADAYRRLVDQFGYDVARLAARVGREKAVVKRALKLGELAQEGRQAYVEGKLSPDAAYVLARVPTSLQPVVFKEALALWTQHAKFARADGDDGPPDPVTGEEMRRFAIRRTLHVLAEAPFDVADVSLVPKAGACPSCPKQTGVQAELFGDVAGENHCADAVCWKDKCAAAWERTKVDAALAGAKVLTADESKKLFDGEADRLRYDAKMVELDGDTGDYPAKKVRSLFKKGELPPVTYARRPSDGAPVALVSRADVERARNKHARASSPAGSASPKEREKKKAKKAEEKASNELLEVIHRRVVEAAVANAEARALGVEQLRALIELFMLAGFEDAFDAIVTRRGLTEGPHEKPLNRYERGEELVRRAAVDANEKKLRGLLVEVGIAIGAVTVGNSSFIRDDDKKAVSLCTLLGVDVKSIAAAARREAQNANVGKAASPKASKGAGAKSKAPKKKGGRR